MSTSEESADSGPNTPVRIYILWHAGYKDGLRLARRIYYWFRLPSGEGIPVYFRCISSEEEEIPDIYSSCDHNILIPLVEANMVASFKWRAYLKQYGEFPSCTEAPSNIKSFFLPVAVDDTAYQIPGNISELNFIRYSTSNQDSTVHADEILLSRLTEAICRKLRYAIDKDHNEPLKIFLSHAKADGTEVPRLIKNFINSETQCQSFFDENDIAYGHDFSDVIQEALKNDSAGLLVVQGDHYADRPWCRKEIRDFLQPLMQSKEDGQSKEKKPPIFSSMPAVVVSNLAGSKIARTIPELGHSSCLQWKRGAARTAVVTLLREILFSNFYRLLAERTAVISSKRLEKTSLIINRPPDPVLIEEVRRVYFEKIEKDDACQPQHLTIHHPGHGLTSVEIKGLKQLYPKLTFCAFGAPTESEPEPEPERKLAGKIIHVSAGNSDDILQQGISDDHVIELLRAVFRPLFKEQISLLYSGALPDHNRSAEPWNQSDVNFTQVFLDLLLSEQNARGTISTTNRKKPSKPGRISDKEEIKQQPRLINLSPWPHCEKITVTDEAQWVNTCSFIKFDQERAQIPSDDQFPSTMSEDTRSITKKMVALSEVRRASCDSLICSLVENEQFKFQSHAHIFIGGKLTKYSGIMPGIWEEALCAFETGSPCFIIGVAQGAAGRLAEWLITPPKKRPPELSSHTPENQSNAQHKDIEGFLKGGGWRSQQEGQNKLWEYIKNSKTEGGLTSLLNNGLSVEDNKQLMEGDNFHEIGDVVLKGLKSLPTSPPK